MHCIKRVHALRLISSTLYFHNGFWFSHSVLSTPHPTSPPLLLSPHIQLPVRSRLGSLGSGAPRKGSRGSLAGQYQRSTSRFRRKDTPISRSLHWGFKSLRPNAPLTSAQLLAVKEVCGWVGVGVGVLRCSVWV